jgi:fibronectin-binding autotransporter adhesin
VKFPPIHKGTLSALIARLAILMVMALCTRVASAQAIFDDDMESYTTATSTSINDFVNSAISDPQFWARNSYQGGGTTVNVTAGITGASGSRAAILEADFTGATDFWGAQLYSAANAGAGTALSFADLTYSFTIASSSGFGFYLNFNSFNSSFEATGTYRKAFTPTAAASFETISGNLAEGGWAANLFGLSANGLELNAANYSWSVEISGEFGWTGSNNSLLIDQATFAVLPQPSTWSGGGTNGDWNTSENWNTLPTINSPLVFTGGTRLTSTNNFAVDTAFNGITFTNTTGDFSLNGNRLVLNGDIIARSPSSGEASHTITTDIFLGDDDRQFIVDPGVLLTVTGAVSENSGSRALIKSGSGTLALAGVNSFGGGLVLGAGTLVLSHASAAGDGMLTQSSNNSTLQINTTGTVANAMSLFNIQTLQTVTLSGNKTLGNATFTVAADTTTTESGVLSGTGGITKEGAGTLMVTASNSFTGNTIVNAGVLDLNSATGSALGASTNVTVSATLLISQSGQVSDTAVVTLSGGTIQRGSGVSQEFGALTVSGSSVLDFGGGTGGSLAFGTYTPSSLLTLNNFFGGNVLSFNSDLTGSIAVGTYNTTSYLSSDGLFQINSISGGFTTGYSGSTFTITAIPEPSAYLALVGLLVIMLWPSRIRLLKKANSNAFAPRGNRRFASAREWHSSHPMRMVILPLLASLRGGCRTNKRLGGHSRLIG